MGGRERKVWRLIDVKVNFIFLQKGVENFNQINWISAEAGMV